MSELVIHGKNPIIEALRSGREIEKIYVAHDSHPPHQVLRLAKEKGVKVQKVSRKKVEDLAGTKKTQGIVALLSPVEYRSSLELFKATIERQTFFIAPDHISDPQNLGNLLRTCEVLGGSGALLPRERSVPVNQTVVKASSGAIFHLIVAKVVNLARELREFKKMGGWIVSVEKGGKDIREVQIPLPCALVLGSEDRGVSKNILEISDLIVTIPMRGKVSSLNVSSAGAIAMWEVFR